MQLRPINIGTRLRRQRWKFWAAFRSATRVVINPPDSLEEGQQVNVAAAVDRAEQNGQPPRNNVRQTRNPPEQANAPHAKARQRAVEGKRALERLLIPSCSRSCLRRRARSGPRYSRPAAPAPAPDAWKTPAALAASCA